MGPDIFLVLANRIEEVQMESAKCIQEFAEYHHEPLTEKVEKQNQNHPTILRAY